jgi:hypothetical protein
MNLFSGHLFFLFLFFIQPGPAPGAKIITTTISCFHAEKKVHGGWKERKKKVVGGEGNK